MGLALAASLGACGTSAGTDTAPPITGITVRAESITVGRGCGTATAQIFKYAVVVSAADKKFVAGNVYDCFADGTFVALPEARGATFTLDVLAFNQADYVASAPGRQVTLGRQVEDLIGNMNRNRAALTADGGEGDERAIQADFEQLKASQPTYSTTCTAEQVQLVQALAICKPLQGRK